RPRPPEHTDFVTLQCSSWDNRPATCQVNGDVVRARLVTKHSNNACILDHSWGVTHSAVWVSHGCRATFEVEVRNGWGGGRDDGRRGPPGRGRGGPGRR